jgi:hypothetical protein
MPRYIAKVGIKHQLINQEYITCSQQTIFEVIKSYINSGTTKVEIVKICTDPQTILNKNSESIAHSNTLYPTGRKNQRT